MITHSLIDKAFLEVQNKRDLSDREKFKSGVKSDSRSSSRKAKASSIKQKREIMEEILEVLKFVMVEKPDQDSSVKLENKHLQQIGRIYFHDE